jgi:GEVED domain/Secretion system C-terminal sorting domain
MKRELHNKSLRVARTTPLIFVLLLSHALSFGQCIVGSNNANLNWDNLDYLVTTGSYSGFVTTAMSRTQAFAIGVNRVQVVYPSTITTSGENITHTGDAGSFGTGADVQYGGNGSITFTFDDEVNNFRFSLFDIDISQQVNVTAVNTLAVPLNVVMTKPAGGTVVITGSGTVNAQGAAPATAHASTSNLATVNVAITGPVKTVTVTMSATAGDFWLSDFTACVTGTFPIDYFVASQPFTGQPTYVIGTSDTNTVSLINTANGQAKMIFQDATSPRYINGISFDHLQYNLYYVIDFTSNPAINKTIKRYNFDTEVMSVLVADVNTLGIPTFSRGVESAGCAFYDNDLYFGVEGNISGNSGGRETIIWRIEFDVPGGNAIKSCQVYATPSDNGSGTVLHDWNDFTIADGLLVDFAGAPTAAARRFTHYDLQTQNIVNNYYTGGLTPRQAGITWDDTRYWVYDSIAVYNMDGTIGPRTRITGPTVLDWVGFCGDATGFRPKSDFGDAPASYDPVALNPALHEKDTALRLGPTWDQEFNKTSSAMATADGSDEDAIATVTVLDTATANYVVNVTVYNNTGQNATVIGWLDINGNGTFQATEGVSVTVPHGGPVLQSVNLAWIGINTPLTIGQNTFLRIRVARTASAMTVNNATGYYNNGEVEDYPVFVFALLPVKLLSFDASLINNEKVELEWRVENESDILHYEVQRSAGSMVWNTVAIVNAQNIPGALQYQATDNAPLKGNSLYRLRIVSSTSQPDKFSTIRPINITIGEMEVQVLSSPVKEQLQLQVTTDKEGLAQIQVFDVSGRLVVNTSKEIIAGTSQLFIADVKSWKDGMYIVVMKKGDEKEAVKFSVVK